VDIPAFGASGTITEIDLQTVSVQNWDITITSIPTSKIVETGFKNYRFMIESGYRRLKRAILIDVNSLKFVNKELLKQLGNVDSVQQQLGELLLDELDQTTNLALFMQYTQGYLKGKKEIRQRRYPLIVRTLESTPEGFPQEIFVFVKAANWEAFEAIQTEIMLHLIAMMPYFDLKNYLVYCQTSLFNLSLRAQRSISS
jgi:miniconductance mechanosensitive channel